MVASGVRIVVFNGTMVGVCAAIVIIELWRVIVATTTDVLNNELMCISWLLCFSILSIPFSPTISETMWQRSERIAPIQTVISPSLAEDFQELKRTQ